MTREQFAKGMAWLAGVFPNSAPQPAGIEAYYAVLQDLDPEVLHAACLKYTSEPHEFFPKPGQLRQEVADMVALADAVPDPWTAWEEVNQQMRAIGSYGEPDFSHRIIRKAVDAVGGWNYLCLSENIVADRARFIEAFSSMHARANDEVRMLPQLKEMAQRLALPGRRKELTDGK
jgi:hypothetical protein